VGQSIPTGSEDTVPVPDPSWITVSCSKAVKVAVTARATSRVIVQVPVPVQPPPDQPEKTDAGVSVAAVSVMRVPCINGAEHVVGQSIPSTLEVTWPVPDPTWVTVSCFKTCCTVT
jgi:hypothetical protein